MRAIVLLTLSTIYIASRDSVFLFPTYFTLRNTRVYISTTNGSNVLAYIGTFVNQALSFGTILGVSNINPYNSHVRFWEYFDYTRARG